MKGIFVGLEKWREIANARNNSLKIKKMLNNFFLFSEFYVYKIQNLLLSCKTHDYTKKLNVSRKKKSNDYDSFSLTVFCFKFFFDSNFFQPLKNSSKRIFLSAAILRIANYCNIFIICFKQWGNIIAIKIQIILHLNENKLSRNYKENNFPVRVNHRRDKKISNACSNVRNCGK